MCAADVAIACRDSRGAFIYALKTCQMRGKVLWTFPWESGWLQNGDKFPCETQLRQKVVRKLVSQCFGNMSRNTRLWQKYTNVPISHRNDAKTRRYIINAQSATAEVPGRRRQMEVKPPAKRTSVRILCAILVNIFSQPYGNPRENAEAAMPLHCGRGMVPRQRRKWR